MSVSKQEVLDESYNDRSMNVMKYEWGIESMNVILKVLMCY